MSEERPVQVARDTTISSSEIIAIVLSVGWLFVVGLFFLILPPQSGESGFDSLRIILILIAILLPIAMIWVAAVAARSAKVMREESARLQSAIDGMRETIAGQKLAGQNSGPTVERKLNEIAQTAKKTGSALATFASSRDGCLSTAPSAAPKVDISDAPPTLELGTSSEDMAPILSRSDLVRALNFPDTDQDTEGFSALRRALKDRNVRQLVQAAQDILTLLSQDGMNMDDLRPDRARPEIWRRTGSVFACFDGCVDSRRHDLPRCGASLPVAI